jgi:hypothetical protein
MYRPSTQTQYSKSYKCSPNEEKNSRNKEHEPGEVMELEEDREKIESRLDATPPVILRSSIL